MRIRPFREEYLPSLLQIEQAAAHADGTRDRSKQELTDPFSDSVIAAFVVTDDDDELNGWGQAGTLEGVEGEVVGYTLLQLLRDTGGYHFLCLGAVSPLVRRQHIGRILLVAAMNRARIQATEFEFEAEEEGTPIYFEALLPASDGAAPRLAAKCEMEPVGAVTPDGWQLYRREL